jgi:DNA-binding PadR family transcriptional regulator
MTFDRDLVRGSLDLMVLAALADAPLYGYLIQKRLREASTDRVRLQAGTLYPLLHKLEADGAIASRWDRGAGRERKWYELTDKGRRRLLSRAVEWSQYVDCIRRLIEPVLVPPAPEPT